MRYLIRLSLYLLLLLALPAAADALRKAEVSEDNLQIMDVFVDNRFRIASLDGYLVEERVVIAIEPFLDALTIRYQINEKTLKIWKNDQPTEFEFQTSGVTDSVGLWAEDEFNRYIDIESLARLFSTTFSYDNFRLKLAITTQDYLFPLQQLELLEKQRKLTKLNSSELKVRPQYLPITLPDQYRLATVPNGHINLGVSLNNTQSSDRQNNTNMSLQFASDLLYHSASLTLSDSNSTDMQGRLSLSKYKTHPEEQILGFFDSYTFGDVSGSNSSLSSATQNGIGAVLSKRPDNYRSQNLAITLKETAPPGWDVEIFRNGRFILNTVVPDDGLLLLEDLETEFGSNYFQIKLFGPYGEVKAIDKYYDLSKNTLSKGDTAYEMFVIDPNHRLINDQSNEGYRFENFGGNFNIGLSDSWQLGIGFINNSPLYQETQQIIDLKNAFSFPGILIENDLSVNQDGGYAQLTTLAGNAMGTDRYSISYQSAKDFVSGRINASGDSMQRFTASYSGGWDKWNYNFRASYSKQNDISQKQLSNRISRYFGRISVSNTLSYFDYEDKNATNSELNSDSLLGTLTLAGYLSKKLRVSAEINYDPRDSSPIRDNTSLLVNWKLEDGFGFNHYFDGRFRFTDEQKHWSLGHRFSWQSDAFQLTLSSKYEKDDKWSILAGFRMFFGYDYHNNRPIFSSMIPVSSASIDAHTYLDRQLNGIPDELDYDLEGVSFYGSQEWQNITSGPTGRTILPGVIPSSTFAFGAEWQTGSRTINKDYVVYTHPGAHVEANMPFYISTEIGGFVSRLFNGNETPIAKVDIELRDKENNVLLVSESDVDGYFNFVDLKPGQYRIRIAKEYLNERGYTASVVGYFFHTPDTGGYVELETILLERVDSNGVLLEEALEELEYNSDNLEPLVWDKDPQKRQNLFELPPKQQQISAPYSLQSFVGKESDANQLDKAHVMGEASELKGNSDDIQSLPSKDIAALPENGSTLRRAIVGSIAQQGSPIELNAPIRQPLIQSTLVYTLQLGAYNDLQNANDLKNDLVWLGDCVYIHNVSVEGGDTRFKVLCGQFDSIETARQFAAKNINNRVNYLVTSVQSEPLNPVKAKVIAQENMVVDGWVIQFYAAAEKQNVVDKIKELGSLGKLLVARKNVNGTVFKCITSEAFSSHLEATQRLNELGGNNGWVSPSSVYESFLPVDQIHSL